MIQQQLGKKITEISKIGWQLESDRWHS